MLKKLYVNFGNFLLSFSDAIDLAYSKIASHQIRTAFISWEIAKAASLPKERIKNLFIAALFHDIGALSIEEKVSLIELEDIDPHPHCIRGEALFKSTPVFSKAAKIIRNHHRPWNQWDTPITTSDVFEAQAIYLADLLERKIDRKQYILHQSENLKEKIVSLSGDQIEDFWLDLSSPRLYSTLLHFGPFRVVEIDYDNIFSIATLFRKLIDFKSRFTATHSTGVAECALILSKLFGLTEEEIKHIKLAGYLHDLGKLAIPNSILEKDDRLTKEEFAIIKQHTYFTYSVLNSIGELEDIAEIAAFHHERLDGTGYPFHVGAEKINTCARIMAVADIFTALTEDRPYRKGMKKKEIKKILKSLSQSNALDKKIVNLLLENFEEISRHVKEKQLVSREEFEITFSDIIK